MFYNLMDGTEIKVGNIDFEAYTVPVEIDGGTMDCPLFRDEDGDLSFTIRKEEVFLHWLYNG